jgi:hypothetical protein
MTNTFRRHHKTIMWIIIVATIVTFVYYLTPMANRSGAGGGGSVASTPVGSIDGEAISPLQFEAALRVAKVAIRMREGHWPTPQETSQALPSVAFQQLYVEAKLKELNLDVPLETTALFTRRVFGIPPGQPFPKDKFEDFVKNTLNEGGKVSEDDFYRWVRDQVGVELLVQLYGMNGDLITSKEAEFFFQRDHLSMSVELARFPLTNYTAQITATPQEVGEFYTNEQANYRLPEREQVNYIPFFSSNYLDVADKMMAGASNLDSQIDDLYRSRDPSSYKDEAGNPLTPEAAKAKIKAEYRLQYLAATAAHTNAMQLIQLFFEGRRKNQPATNQPAANPVVTNQLITKGELEKFAATNGLAVVTTPPFDEEHPPAEMQFPAVYLNMLLQLKSSDTSAFTAEDIKDVPKLATRLARQSDPVSAFLWQQMPKPDQDALTNSLASATNLTAAEDVVIDLLDKIIEDPCIYESARFKDIPLRPETSDLIKREPTGWVLARLNRMLLEDAYPAELARSLPGEPEEQYRLIPATNGFFFLGLERKLPSQNQPFEVVSNKVAEDYRDSKAMELAEQAGAKFEAAAQAGLAKGLSFDDICAEQKIKPQALTPFTVETKSIPEIEDPGEFGLIARYVFGQLAVGQMSRFEPTPTGGFLIYVKGQTPVSDEVMQRDLPAFLATQREQRQMAAFSIWMGREMQLHVVRPAAKPAAGQAVPPSSG